jgi:hypothetical protein
MCVKITESNQIPTNLRQGCGFCFETMTANYPREGYEDAVACSQCGQPFHKACWLQCSHCDFCRCKDCLPVPAMIPPPLVVVNRTRAIPIRPSKVDRVEKARIPLFKATFSHFGELIRAIIVSVILVTLAIAAGIFTYPVWGTNLGSFETIMDAVFKQPLPSQEIINTSIICGLVFGWICFVSWRANGDEPVPGSVAGFTKLVGGMMIMAGIDIYLLRINPMDITRLFDSISIYGPMFYAQGITLLLIMLLTILNRALAPLKHPLSFQVNISKHLINVFGWIRFIFVCLLLTDLVAFLVTFSLPWQVNQPVFFGLNLGNIQVLVTEPFLASLASALAVASICCWPPRFRRLIAKTGLLRLLVVIGCLGAVALIYRNAYETEALAATIPYATGLMIMAIPLQRSLS